MSAYLKAAAPFVAGVVLVVLGAVLEDETLRQLGYGAVIGSGITVSVPNKK